SPGTAFHRQPVPRTDRTPASPRRDPIPGRPDDRRNSSAGSTVRTMNQSSSEIRQIVGMGFRPDPLPPITTPTPLRSGRRVFRMYYGSRKRSSVDHVVG